VPVEAGRPAVLQQAWSRDVDTMQRLLAGLRTLN
jgi:hypothetical protein